MGIFGGIVYGLWASALSWWDIREQRLPDALTIPAGVLAVTFANWGGLLWPLLYLLVALRGAGIGGGDIKLALPLGMLVGASAGPLAGIIARGGGPRAARAEWSRWLAAQCRRRLSHRR